MDVFDPVAEHRSTHKPARRVENGRVRRLVDANSRLDDQHTSATKRLNDGKAERSRFEWYLPDGGAIPDQDGGRDTTRRELNTVADGPGRSPRPNERGDHGIRTDPRCDDFLPAGMGRKVHD
jgi:hypothetical protein